jgi:cobalt-zinc-cadmium efflux system membrane fusion protein
MSKPATILLLVAILLQYSCEKISPQENNATATFCIPDSLMKNITVDTVKSTDILSELSLSGKITFNEDHVVQIFPFIGGHVTDVKISLGDYVQKGQLLATINSTEMAGYNSELQSAKSELEIAKKNLEVTTDMRNGGVASEKDLITARADYEKALAQYNKINDIYRIYGNSVNSDESTESEFNIKSPISGFIVSKNINAGMEIRPDNGNSLFTISDLKVVWVMANVYETDLDKIKLNDEVEVSTLSYPDKKFKGKIDKISNVLDPATNVLSVRISLPNNDYSLKPGMFTHVSVLFPGKNKMLAIPSSAVFYDDNKTFVVQYRNKCDVGLQQVRIKNTFNNICYLDADSVSENNLVIDRNGLFIFTALKKL